ncbi:CFF_collapsed_G0035320.mRNA.1.CDS.1 [Saccharomyces cerevisiae]|nr:CFF_HP2_G0030350.mRNA.1.CDS.1 [Saccharomyces cerevisiae]CAI6588484.1 CFF_HP2_G0030350.mRNA.1.CDS.1 [Saccharomyces cerevisiae]CAI6669543.1 CFF_HP1_G0032040.mRNA.1.CDS.1 [Saccharomyces cerevisiae]CAI7401595.1 CFF_collapsed_G0035320.mRNA.1.CDS.1 [Saccharomyces cerevisiae]
MEIENEQICTCIAQILHLLNSLIITFLDDDKTETGQSFVYIDGFLVKKHSNQHTIVNFETYKNKMKVSDRRKFEKANFDEFESALNNKNDLVHCPSITLFESIPTEVRSFYEDEKSGLIKVVKFRTGAMDRKRSFEKIVVSVMVGKNVQKFLTFVEDEPDFQGGPIPSKYLIPKKINLMVYTLFQVHTLKFNRKDYDTLSLFYLNRGYYNELSFRTNSNTNATTTESTNSSTSATTTASTNSNTSATTTESTDSNTSATTTASTNSSTNATTTESTNASAKEDANKDGNAEDNRFHPVTDINKESYKRKGSQMVLLERKKLKAQFPNTSENMNVLQFLGFRSDEIKHLFLYGIDIYFCPEGVFTQYGLCKGCQKMFELCVCWAGQKVSYRRIAWEALAVERMLRNDEEYKEYLEDIEPYHGDPVGYLKYFSVKRREIYSQIQRNYAWYLAITRRRETISVLDSTRGKQGSQVFRMSGRQIKELYYKVWSNLCESKTEVLQYFLNWDEKKCQEEWEAKDDTVFVEALEKVGVFQRLRSMTSAGLQGPQYVKLQFSRHHRQLRSRYELSLGMHLRDQLALGVTPSKVPHWTAFLSMLIGLFCNKTFRQKLEYLLEQISEVWLLPHWVDLANVEVLAADNTRVPLYMLMVAVHKELDSDDVPDGRFDILLCRDSSREVGE